MFGWLRRERKPPGHKHVWRFEMFGPTGSRECCADETCRARRYRSPGGGEVIEATEAWRRSPPVDVEAWMNHQNKLLVELYKCQT